MNVAMDAKPVARARVHDDPFYRAYAREGQGVILAAKHMRQFRKDFVEASEFDTSMSVLELGCGNGLFLRFLQAIGVEDFEGVDGDARVMQEMPPEIARRVSIAEFDSYFARPKAERCFDRIVMFDVLEHFSVEEAVQLLKNVASLLKSDGCVVIRIPNVSSPFGLAMQFNDVTHRAAYTPGSLRQVASAAGLVPVAFRRQTHSSRLKNVRERAFTGVLSWFLAAPPAIWTPNFIAVLRKR
jgi:cyclopropane fatty-acyl-phospholipid synthase-like methyltransferase